MLKLGRRNGWGEKFCTVGKSQARMWVSTMDRARDGRLGVAACLG